MVRRHKVRDHVRRLGGKKVTSVKQHVRGDADPREKRLDRQGYPRLSQEGIEHHALQFTDTMRSLAADGYSDEAILEYIEDQVLELDIGSANRNSIVTYLKNMMRDQPTEKQWAAYTDQALLYIGRSDDVEHDRSRAEDYLLDAPWQWVPGKMQKKANEAIDTAVDDHLAEEDEAR